MIPVCIVKELVDASFLPSFSIAAVEKARLSILRLLNQCHAYLTRGSALAQLPFLLVGGLSYVKAGKCSNDILLRRRMFVQGGGSWGRALPHRTVPVPEY